MRIRAKITIPILLVFLTGSIAAGFAFYFTTISNTKAEIVSHLETAVMDRENWLSSYFKERNTSRLSQNQLHSYCSALVCRF